MINSPRSCYTILIPNYDHILWTCKYWRGCDGRLTFAPARDAAGSLSAGHRRPCQAPADVRHPSRTSLCATGGSTQPGAMPPKPATPDHAPEHSPGTEKRIHPINLRWVGGKHAWSSEALALAISTLFVLECFWLNNWPFTSGPPAYIVALTPPMLIWHPRISGAGVPYCTRSAVAAGELTWLDLVNPVYNVWRGYEYIVWSCSIQMLHRCWHCVDDISTCYMFD